jgi:mRNA interferase HigB
MRVISKSRLRKFWESPNFEDSEGPLRAWYTHVNNKEVTWKNWGDVKAIYATADAVGNCAVFDIGGNKYRLIARILYPSQKVFILKVMTHKEYDKGQWKVDCGCFSAPPKKTKKKVAARPKQKRKGR